jgi:ABC-type Na+ efflux pump permease subunit
MRDDITTVVWKELSEVRSGNGQGRRAAGGIAIASVFVAIVLPFSAGAEKFGGMGAMMIGAIIGMMWVLTSVPDSFAGERDHRTLETLLATRLPADAILAGKLLASVVVAVVLGTVAIVLSVISANVGSIVHGGADSAVSVPWLDMGLGVVLVTLAAFALTNVGILVALRASSAMVAMRELGIGLAATVFAVSFAVHSLPKGASTDLADAATEIGSLSPVALAALVAVVFVAVNAVLFGVTRARFTRPKLVHPHG